MDIKDKWILFTLSVALATLLLPLQTFLIVAPLIGIIIVLITLSFSTIVYVAITNILLMPLNIIYTDFLSSREWMLHPTAIQSLISVIIFYPILGFIIIIMILRKIKSDLPVERVLSNLSIAVSHYLDHFCLAQSRLPLLYSLLSVLLFILAKYSSNIIIITNNIIFNIINIIFFIIFFIVFIPFYTTSLHLVLTSLLISIASLRYPPIILTLAVLLPFDTLETYYRALRKEGAEIGEIVAVLQRNPLIRYKELTIETKSTYKWATIYSKASYRLNLEAKENPHIIITGSSGSGKSFTAAVIADSLSRTSKGNSPSILIIDPHGEYNDYVRDALIVQADKYSINPLDLNDSSPRQRAIEVALIISNIFNLGPLQSRILEEAIIIAYESKGIIESDKETWKNTPPSLKDVANILRKLAYNDKRAAVVAMYIDSLVSRIFGKTSISIDKLLEANKPIILDLSGLGERTWQQLFTELLLEKIYIYLKEKGITDKLRLIMIIDEAHLFASKTKRQNVVVNMAAELRKYGLSLILVTQKYDDIDNTILANIGTKIALRHTEPKTAKQVAEALASGIEQDELKVLVETLNIIPQGYAIIRDYYIDKPLLVKVITN
jgi:energy-coupling factor transporter ATP-binding protein EcfA2/GTP-binding protein EngB required for normal cell division